ncbi:hypothetical protein NLG97_g3127 [Lecanicillium saksenae]|uniref:Uncharacterized protein n=1 Tax=Lecanicillium saksenae TaxID=468837 RepID=A0ACC1R0D0_9HYPO|nr:hypothetical protein NLG97_g3127 [Lecanicillium saksenae]
MTVRFLQLLSLLPMALAGTVQYPEVIPGPGLPSLESLGLTSEELWTKPFPEIEEGKLVARFEPFCSFPDRAYTSVNDLRACYNYLNALGSTACEIDPDHIVGMCSSGGATVYGASLVGHRTSSKCEDVAKGLLWVVQGCTRSDQSCAGSAPAYGNGDLEVFGAASGYY